jgi:aspartyl-tRNA(Asn)/glutamyl-tRNA(Gln) amidotransferase subunit A
MATHSLLPDATDICALSASALSEAFRRGSLSPIEVIERVIRRTEEVNGVLNAIVAMDADAARTAAKQSEQRWRAGRPLSPLDGVPITVKDNLFVAGLPARWGSKLLPDSPVGEDEPCIARLRRSGVNIFGKTNIPEFTLQGYTGNLLHGVCRNPLAPDRTPGGSTGGGAAAVAAGLSPIAIGTDGGGSLRRPASHCGLYGFKPSLGQVPRFGGFPQILHDFEAVGPIARSLDDISAVLSLMVGDDLRDPRSVAADGGPGRLDRAARIAFIPRAGSAPIDPLILAQAERTAAALREIGCIVEETDLPVDVEQGHAVWRTIATAGLAWYLEKYWPGQATLGHVTDNTIEMAEAGARVTGSQYIEALQQVSELRVQWGGFFETWDFVLTPTTAALAWDASVPYPTLIDRQSVGPRGHSVFTVWVNLIRGASVSFPVATTQNAGGVGMQLVAPAGRDRRLLAWLLENAERLPPLATVA